MTNREFSRTDEGFKAACEKVNLTSMHKAVAKTRKSKGSARTSRIAGDLTRQASKWRRGKGIAYKEGRF
jgi:hypothetical protein